MDYNIWHCWDWSRRLLSIYRYGETRATENRNIIRYKRTISGFPCLAKLNEELTFCCICHCHRIFRTALAVVYGSPKTNIPPKESTSLVRVSAGLLAALGQAAGVLFLRPVGEGETLQTSSIRFLQLECFMGNVNF